MPAASKARASRARLERRVAERQLVQLERARRDCAAFIEHAIRDEETGAKLRNAPFHREWHAHLDKHHMAVLVAPVEHAKTQQIAVGRVLWELGRNRNLRVALVGNRSTDAEKQLRSIRTHIERNPAVHRVFPHLRPSPHEEDPWHSSQITVARETIAKDPSVSALGAFGPPGARYDLIVVDDILDLENTRTEEQRKKLIEWFDTTLFTRLTPNGRIMVIGTPWHPDDLLHVLSSRPGFHARRYCAVDNPDDEPTHWRPIWPERWPLKRLLERFHNTAETVFQRKYLCRVRQDSTARFKEEWLQRMVRLGRGRTFVAESPKTASGMGVLPCFTGVDVGPGEKKQNALSVIFTIALMERTERRLVLEIQAGHWKGPDLVDRLVSTYMRFQSVIMVETNGAQKFIRDFAGERIPVDAFNTGANKWDERYGVESLAVEMRNMLWVCPSGQYGETVHPEAEAWIREMLHYNPEEHTGDRLMASWLAREAARRHTADVWQHVDTQAR